MPSESAGQLTLALVCPKCYGQNVNQYRTPSGPGVVGRMLGCVVAMAEPGGSVCQAPDGRRYR